MQSFFQKAFCIPGHELGIRDIQMKKNANVLQEFMDGQRDKCNKVSQSQKY